MKLDDLQSVSHAYKGDALRKLGRIDEAMIAYRDAVARGYYRGDAYIHLGSLLIEKGEITAGVEIMEQGLTRVPDDIYLLNHLAYVYGFTLNQGGKSHAYYQRVLIQDSVNTHALHGSGVLYLQEGQIEKGINSLQQLLQLDPDNGQVRKLIDEYTTQ